MKRSPDESTHELKSNIYDFVSLKNFNLKGKESAFEISFLMSEKKKSWSVFHNYVNDVASCTVVCGDGITEKCVKQHFLLKNFVVDYQVCKMKVGHCSSAFPGICMKTRNCGH